jgi:histidyl-tRNA synthetase
MTPTLARMVGARARALPKPIRWFSMPQLFRYERKQRGRLREHFQLNMDILGESDVLADAELLAAAIDVCRTTGLDSSQVRARVSDRRVLAAIFKELGVSEGRLEAVYGVVDKLDREPRARLEERLAELGLKPEAVDGIFQAVELRGADELRVAYGSVPRVAERVAELSRYLEHLDDMGVADFVDVDLSVVRGLAYYTGIVFELWDARRELRAICGGGRYDDLLKLISGVEMPALGFGMGDVVLAELLREHGLVPDLKQPTDCFIAYMGDEARRYALRSAGELRRAGISVVYDFRERRLAGQLKAADQMGARLAIIIGPQEIEEGAAQVRDMVKGDSTTVPFDALVSTIRGYAKE